MPVGEDRWRLTADRGATRPRLRLDSMVESFDWDDSTAVLTGSMTLKLPPRKIDLTHGHLVICEHARGGGRFREVWRMRISAPNADATGGYQLTLSDDMALLQASKDDFDYRKDKRHPNGWLPHQIAADIARRYRFRIGRMVRTTHRIKKLHRPNASPLEALTAALLKEKVAKKRKMVMRWRRGRLEVLPLRRSREMLALGPMLIDAGLTTTMRENLATAVTVRATAGGKGKKKQRISRLVVSRAAAARYGFIHRKITASDADTLAEAVAFARRRLASLAEPERELTVTVPGVPTLRRGAAMRVSLPELGLKSIVFAKAIRHSVTPGGYTMEVTCGFDDPLRDRGAEQRDKKAATAKKRGRKAPKGHTQRPKRPKPKKARVRGDRRTGGTAAPRTRRR